MGAGQIVQNNIQSACEGFWKKMFNIPELSIKLENYNKPFLNFVALVGMYAVIKSSIVLGKKSFNLIKGKPKVPSKEQMQFKYGDYSWALIVDCKRNEDYCLLLAQRGFGLILCGQEEDIKIVQHRLVRQTQDLNYRTQNIIINWSKQAKNLAFYEQLEQKLKHFDISIMVMPRINKQNKCLTHEQPSPAFEHIYLMARHFAPKLKWRSNASAIIVPSQQNLEVVDSQYNGVSRAVQAGIDAFGRILDWQFKGAIQVIVARGTAQNALAYLGKSKISH